MRFGSVSDRAKSQTAFTAGKAAEARFGFGFPSLRLMKRVTGVANVLSKLTVA